jgi:hypothetical protein
MRFQAWLSTIVALMAMGADGPPKFERVVIDADFPGGYQVEVADVNGDKKPDIVALGGSTLAWYENPSWKKRVVSTAKQTPDIISSATADLDGDGKAEIAIAYDFAMNEPKRGKLLLAIQGPTPDDPWTFKPVMVGTQVKGSPEVDRSGGGGGGIGGAGTAGGFGGGTNPSGMPIMSHMEWSPADFPSIHRLRWGWIVGKPVRTGKTVSLEKKLELVVAPIFGPTATPPAFNQEPAQLFYFGTGDDPKSGRWTRQNLGEAHVLHAIEVVHLDGDDRGATVLGASNRGVTATRPEAIIGGAIIFQTSDLAPGAQGVSPKKGASEVHLGRFKDGMKFVATVEPWHGTDVVIYASASAQTLKLGPRNVIDSTLKEGHALWVADVDGDGDDEVFAGYRGGTGGVNVYDFDGSKWNRSVLDPDVTAQDLRGGDLDGDGTPDVVAIGGKSHNVVWYRPIRRAK